MEDPVSRAGEGPVFVGARVALYPMADDYVDRILGAIGALAPWRATLTIETDDLGTTMIGPPEPLFGAMRDLFAPDIEEVVVDSQDVYLRIKDFADKLMPAMAERIRMHDSTTPLFHAFGIETEVEGLYESRVELPNGGSIVIDQTEALVAIDRDAMREAVCA